MKKVFTKYLFGVFLIPVFILIVFYCLYDKAAIGTYGVNRTINFRGIDINAIVKNPIYNSSAFIITYLIYIIGYLIVFLIRRFTNFFYSILNFTIVILNYIVLSNNSANRILLPLTILGLIIFIFNIFKTTKNPTTINQKPLTI